ncbi:hypothetical protein A2V82_09440 [candidate division KSB1 bacterium RBG_16_48_16]|nr:MAG: hypothetical protein A2V82_09440 [candidate division KSB1 bacterium RBG_16_48_16]
MRHIRFSVLISILLIAGLALARERMNIDETYHITGPRLTVEIDVDGGQVQVKRSESDTDCHVWLEYNPNKSNADVQFNERTNELKISVDHEKWSIVNKGDDENFVKVVVELPLAPQIDLDADVKAGEMKLQLGGIHLRNFELRNLAGEVNVDFDQPNKSELETLDVNCKVGELTLSRLGNANFSEADINSGIGEVSIDFLGEKIRRAMVHIDLDIGETRIVLPKELGVKMKVSKFLFLSNVSYPNWFDKKGKYYFSKNYKETKESLYLTISTGIGELGIEVE